MGDDLSSTSGAPEPPQLSRGYTMWTSVLALLGLTGVLSLLFVAMLLARQDDGDPWVLGLPVAVWTYAAVVTAPVAIARLRGWRYAASATFVHCLVMIPLSCLAVPGLVWLFTGLRREREWQRLQLDDRQDG